MSLFKKITLKLTDYENKKSVGSKLRAKRIAPLLLVIRSIYEKKGQVLIADIGGTEEYWNIMPHDFLERYAVEITIINLPGIKPKSDSSFFKFIYADACDLSQFKDGWFDVAHSNSVIEHVGRWEQMVKYSCEVRRIAKNYFIQTPNYWFPIEPHCMTPFFQWLPMPMRIWLVMNFQLGNWAKAKSVDQAIRAIEGSRLLNKKML